MMIIHYDPNIGWAVYLLDKSADAVTYGFRSLLAAISV